jgi:uncharacterized protein (TIGR03083 family)
VAQSITPQSNIVADHREFQDAASIRPLSHAEAAQLATAELDRFLGFLETLSEDDWSKPTACPLWDVRQMVAHKAGSEAGFARWTEFKRQYFSPSAQRPYRKDGFSMLDTTNQIQVDDRANRSPVELIDELREVGPRAIATRYRLPALLRAIRLPMPVLGFARIDYLTDHIYSRDMWMHRLDIARATGRTMDLTAEHDGRMVALIARDLSGRLERRLPGTTVGLDLGGLAGGRWRIGREPVPVATLQMDTLDFAWLASDRITAADFHAQGLVTIIGDRRVGERALERLSVPF